MWTGAEQSEQAARAGVARVLLMMLLVAAVPAFARAAPDEQVSLEWAVEQSELVVRGMVRATAGGDLIVGVDEAIKGPAGGPVVTITVPGGGVARDVARPLDDVLVFCDRAAGATGANAPSGRVGGWVVHGDWAIVLGERTRAVVRMDGTLVTGGDALVSATREAAAFGKARAKPCESAVIPIADDASLPDGGPSRGGPPPAPRGVLVPADGRLEALAVRWLDDREWSRRQHGVAAIAPFRSPDNVARVRKVFVNDGAFYVEQAEEWSPRVEERYWREFPVRQAALNRLLAWGEPSSADGEIRSPLLRYGPVTWGGWVAGAIVVLVVAGAGAWRWGLGTFTAIALLGVAVAVFAGWWRASGEAATYSVAGLGADWEVVSAGGRVAVLRVQDDGPPHGWVARPYDADEGARLWFAPYLDTREDAAAGGCRFATGVTAGAGGYSFKLVELPYWLLLSAALAWPVIHVAGRVRRARRRRRRRARAGRCGVCGAGLGGATGRCPQCGAGV